MWIISRDRYLTCGSFLWDLIFYGRGAILQGQVTQGLGSLLEVKKCLVFRCEVCLHVSSGPLNSCRDISIKFRELLSKFWVRLKPGTFSAAGKQAASVLPGLVYVRSELSLLSCSASFISLGVWLPQFSALEMNSRCSSCPLCVRAPPVSQECSSWTSSSLLRAGITPLVCPGTAQGTAAAAGRSSCNRSSFPVCSVFLRK